MVIGELVLTGSRMLKLENPVREARLILSFVTGISVTDMMIHPEKEIDGRLCENYMELIKKRNCGMPFAYITGEKEFYGHTFKVTPDVLIPRADTEILVELAADKKPESLIDICTGSGCIAISVKKACPEVDITAVDISEAAICVAKENAKKLEAAVTFIKQDILNEIPAGRFDFLASNPPYIKKEDITSLEADVKNYEPTLALDGGDSGLIFYERICRISPEILNPGGMAAFEIGFNQFDDVYNIMKENFKNIDFVPDLSGIRRVIFGSLRY